MESLKSSECQRNGLHRPHVLMVPLPGFSHFHPFLQLLYHLDRHQGVTVTVVCTESRIFEISKLRDKGDFQNLDLRLEKPFGERLVYSADPRFPVRTAPDIERFMLDFEPVRKKLIEDKSLPGAPTAVVTDMFNAWAQVLASELDIPWYPLYPAPPQFALSILESPRLFREGLHPKTYSRKNEAVNVPGLEFLRVRDLWEQILDFPDFFGSMAERTRKASAILLNTAEELEAPCMALEAYRENMQLGAAGGQAPRIWPIGPILNLPGFTGRKSGGSHDKQDFPTQTPPCLQFLDTQASASVVFIAFGSIANISGESVIELAHGLEASGLPFLWVLKLDRLASKVLSEVLPNGFVERTKGRGFVETGWAPQSQILLHPSTGGFLTHCGWNSTMESVCGGVPLITWPVSADQLANARYIQRLAKIGVSVMIGDEDSELLPSRENVRNAVRTLMVGDEGKKMRKNVEEMKKRVTEAVAEGGSSHQALQLFLNEILLKSPRV